ncbi:hypothetical protein [Nocardiopsis listeri]|uniref:hypothetical protein n=1 Tax=Nocardiopsis listeri TaxID=53440 RepID=UPI0012EDAE7A|nr:hypothetical protein [Nocardiopsis listeri]
MTLLALIAVRNPPTHGDTPPRPSPNETETGTRRRPFTVDRARRAISPSEGTRITRSPLGG